ncbi:MAG: 2-amino-4-hydroxy-6-hydroxymethyldihydropteridine diphosphokinase [Proteobacteria bacterium]|nr:2-amino-4-hydroxy-6-hydroxymethyldihydropteridine diphosphokinase [Pseudomonadota bacterium]
MLAYIGIGSNLGDKICNIKKAIEYLKENKKIVSVICSSLYETEPVGYKDQPEFINGVLKIDTTYSLQELFLFLKNVEKKMGRTKTVKYGPRIIDLDILFFEDKIYIDLDITVPHPQLHKRTFVLYPLIELQGDFIHPLFCRSLKKLIEELYEKTSIKLLNISDFKGSLK